MEAVRAGLPYETNGAKVDENGGLVRVETILRGATPLMMNAMPVEVLLAMREGKKGAKTKAKPGLREEAESKLHVLPDGRLHVPVDALFKAMIGAGVFVRLDGKRQVSTKAETTLPGLMEIEDAVLPIYVPGSEEAPKWEVDIRQGRNPNGGEAVCLVRPRIDGWEIRPTFRIDLSQFPMASARMIVEWAGRRLGLLEFRPQRKGVFGKYDIVQWKILE